MANWQVQEAKSQLSKLMELSKSDGPQTITKHGKPEVVVLSKKDYEAMRRDKPSLIEFLLNEGPTFDDFDIERSKDTGREIDLD
jgi:prevent-host-death family protein